MPYILKNLFTKGIQEGSLTSNLPDTPYTYFVCNSTGLKEWVSRIDIYESKNPAIQEAVTKLIPKKLESLVKQLVKLNTLRTELLSQMES